jgi:cation transport ATPase
MSTSEEREEKEKRGHAESREEEAFAGPWWQFRPFQGAVVSGVFLALGFALSRLGTIAELLAIRFYLAAIPPGAFFWLREGFEELVNERTIGNEALMAAATVGACVLGAWEEAAFLVFLYGSAEAAEEYTSARTRSAIRALLDLAPKEARVLRDGVEVTVPAIELVPSDVFIVRPGEGIPTDGKILEGAGTLDEAAVTGESVPVEKGPGALVFAGTINRTGALRVNATKRFEDNTLSTIIHMV